MFIKKYYWIQLFIIIINIPLFGQNTTSSPYSRFGVGNVQPNPFLRAFSMGGTTYALKNHDCINLFNPASYTAFPKNTFLLETGFQDKYTKLNTQTESFSNNDVSFDYFSFGFPINRRIGAVVGLLPYSKVGYNISDSKNIPDVGNVDYMYSGFGGINRMVFGVGVNTIKNLSIGLNVNYLFGKLERNQTAYFPYDSVLNYFDMRIKNKRNISGFVFDFGAIYTINSGDSMKINIGVVAGNKANVNLTYDEYAERFIRSNTVEYVIDTISKTIDENGNFVMPMYLGAGISFEKLKKSYLLVGIDLKYQKWSDYSYLDVNENLKNSLIGRVGCEYVPQTDVIKSYWKRIHYRIGGYYEQTYLDLKNTQLVNFGTTFGLSFPLRRIKVTGKYAGSYLNIGVNLGQRGSTDNNLIQEQYAIFNFGLTLSDIWFIKRKIN